MPGGVLGHDFKECGIGRGIHVLLAFERRAVLPAAITRQIVDQFLHWLPGCDLAIFHLPVDEAGFGSRRAGSRSICVELIDVKLPVGNITQLHGVDLHVGTILVGQSQRQFGDIAEELAVQRRSSGRDRHDAIHQQVVGSGVVHILLRADVLTKDFQFFQRRGIAQHRAETFGVRVGEHHALIFGSGRRQDDRNSHTIRELAHHIVTGRADHQSPIVVLQQPEIRHFIVGGGAFLNVVRNGP